MRRLRALTALSLSMLSLAACAPVPASDVDVEPVIHGTRETGYPEVVAVYWQPPTGTAGGGLCTGTIIGPHAVLTAKHCVFQEGPPYVAVPPEWFYVIEGDDINHPGTVHAVSEVRTTPGTDVDTDVADGSDIAILLLPDTLTPTPRGYATHQPPGGSSATVVGFGRTMTGTPSPTDAGLKYSGTMTIRRTGTTQILAAGSSWTCQGDSGGPLIDGDGNVCGITSFGFDGTCLNSNSVFTAVSAWTSLITDALAWAPPCMPHAEICNGLDDDCNGTADDGLGCAPVGAPCTMGSECASTRCAMAGGSMICTQTCFPDMMITPCPTGTHCEVQGCGAGLCAPGAPGAGGPGETCTADTDCASGYCAELQGRHLCGAQCWPAGGTGCGDGLDCNLRTAMDCGACVPTALSMGPRPIGASCTTDADCASMHCAASGHYCTDPCTSEADCPSSYHCNGSFCAPGPLSMAGGACSTSGDCATSAPDCIDGQCAASCDAGACPDGFVCASTASGDRCLRAGAPLGGACTMASDCRSNLCLTTGACSAFCDTTACPAGYDCVDAGGPHVCVAAAPASSGGCTCSMRSPSTSWSALVALVALGALVRWRRARR